MADYPDRLRFVNYTGTFSIAGRLAIYLNGVWGTICDNGFGTDEATLACQQLGYQAYSSITNAMGLLINLDELIILYKRNK